jgi:hypothetical protein
MGTIIPFPNRQEGQTALETILHTYEVSIGTALEEAATTTACFKNLYVSSFQCVQACTSLHHLLQQVDELYQLVEPPQHLVVNRYPVVIQGHHVALLLEKTIQTIQEAAGQKDKRPAPKNIWQETRQHIQTYPAQVRALLEEITKYRQRITIAR